ncbi:MAG: trigger factor [Mangrovibacterium sp.]
MNISRENINELSATLTLKIEKADYADAVEKTLKDYRKKVNMPGFRPGKVPAGLVRKQYGTAVLADEINRIISAEIPKYVEAEKINMLGDPLPNEEKQAEINWESQEEFEFIFDIAWAPEFEVKIDKRKKYPYYQIDVTEEMVDKQVESYTQRMGQNIPVEVAAEKDTLRVDIAELDADGNEVEDGVKAGNVAIAIDLMKDDAIKAEAIGIKVGGVLTFDPVKVYGNKHEVAHMLNIPHDQIESIEEGKNYKFTVVEVLQFQEAELNEEFFAMVLGKDTEVKTIEAFRAKMKEDIAKNYEQSSEYKFLLDAKEILVDKIAFDLPEEFLKRWLLETNKEMTHASLEENFAGIINDFRWQLIRDKVAKDNEVKLEQEDVTAIAKKTAAMQFAQYGMGSAPDDLLENYAQQMLQDEKNRSRMMNQAFEEKVLAVIKGKVAIDEKMVSEEEFAKLFETK